MKNTARIALLIFAAGGSAGADSFTLENLPPSASPEAVVQPAGKSYFKSADLNTFAAASSLDQDGYIGTVHLNDSFTLDLSSGPTAVAVPEPASLVLFGSGLALAALRRRRKAV